MASGSRQNKWSSAIETSALIVGLIIASEGVDWLAGHRLDTLGILPRTIRGLLGIVFGPLLHLGFAHLSANAFPLFVLLVLLFGARYPAPGRTLALVWIGSGLGTWLIGRGNTIHIGASSLIYGLVVYLIAAGFWIRSLGSVAIAAAVLLLYGGIFYGVLPQHGMVSWEGHLAGAVIGLLVAQRSHA
jgi:membrane associated rhomboid family serine protease